MEMDSWRRSASRRRAGERSKQLRQFLAFQPPQEPDCFTSRIVSFAILALCTQTDGLSSGVDARMPKARTRTANDQPRAISSPFDHSSCCFVRFPASAGFVHRASVSFCRESRCSRASLRLRRRISRPRDMPQRAGCQVATTQAARWESRHVADGQTCAFQWGLTVMPPTHPPIPFCCCRVGLSEAKGGRLQP